ncbi:MAG: hypothetical protein ACP5JJ_11875 [Anaerolineae bacterium]
MNHRRTISVLGSLALAVVFLLPWATGHVLGASPAAAPGTVPVPTTQIPVEDRLAEPVLPESPTQVDIGRNLYYFHCMPCHGDRGQGLTDEWREVWVEDHQNCWGRGCHAARSEFDAFRIPRTVPAVIGSPPVLGAFQAAEDLFAFLRATQPPQRPGALSDAEYWALTGFLLHENGRQLMPIERSPTADGPIVSNTGLALALLAPLLALALATALARRPAGTSF